jgi:hypothetical protein
MSMHGSKTEFIVQVRVQDYWIDSFDSTFTWKPDAEKRMEVLKEHNPKDDFQLIKRITRFEDEVLFDV